MALSDDDKADIAAMIAEANKPAAPRPGPGSSRPRTQPQGGGEDLSQSDWDRMSPLQQRSWVRQVTEERLAELDAEAERENLRAENEELRQRVAEWEKAGKPGRRPAKADGDKPRSEEAPTIVSKAYKFLFGEVGQNP